MGPHSTTAGKSGRSGDAADRARRDTVATVRAAFGINYEELFAFENAMFRAGPVATGAGHAVVFDDVGHAPGIDRVRGPS